MSINSILVAIDPTRSADWLLMRAGETALQTNASVLLYVCLSEQVLSGAQAKQREDLQAEFSKRLDEYARRVQDSGVASVQTQLEWNEDWPMAIVAAADKANSDIVFKISFSHSNLDRGMRETSDWQILRSASCPVLLIKEQRDWDGQRIVAAVAPSDGDKAHRELNSNIIRIAADLSQAHGANTHYVSAYQHKHKRPDVEEMAQLVSAEPHRIHIEQGWADEVIVNKAAELNANLLLIGTVGRSGVKASVIGNTAEKVLDKIGCDVLVLPAKAKSGGL